MFFNIFRLLLTKNNLIYKSLTAKIYSNKVPKHLFIDYRSYTMSLMSKKKLEELSKDELISQINYYKCRVSQLESRIANIEGTKYKKKKKQRPLVFDRYKQRAIALKVAYLGWDYQGLASQESSENTIMGYLISALEKSNLIEDRNSCNIQLCGRTDKGVSGFSQVISLYVRSNLKNPEGEIEGSGSLIHERFESGEEEENTEIDYPQYLNRGLPRDIKILGWAATSPEFSARFSCKGRSYKYFFTEANLDVEKMRTASQYFLGEHDFRNFCKMVVKDGAFTFVREIKSISIDCIHERPGGCSTFVINVVGSGFLYHQIRCMVSVLFLVGKGHEPIETVETLLSKDLHNEGKPQYVLAEDFPLLFYDSEFENLKWNLSEEAETYTIKSLQTNWTTYEIKSQIVKTILDGFSKNLDKKYHFQANILSPEIHTDNHKSLFKRPKEPTMEERMQTHENKKKLRFIDELDS